MLRLYWKDMDSDAGHLSPVGLLILAPLSHWSRMAEQNLNCRLNPAPPPMPEDMGDKTGKSNSQPALPSAFFFFSLSVVITSPPLSVQRRERRRSTCATVRRAHMHTHIGCWISEWKRGESVTRAAGLGVDYRTPEEIFLSPQTVSGRGLTTAEPQDKHLHFFSLQYTTLCKEAETQSRSGLNCGGKWKKKKKKCQMENRQGACGLYLPQSARMSESFCRGCAI